jgi:hypothetical protein
MFTPQAGTKVSTGTIIPHVQILALQVHFDLCDEVKTVPSFLECFPNVKTLHIRVKLPPFIWHFASVSPLA